MPSGRALIDEVRACTACAKSLPAGPRPIVQFSPLSRIVIIGQAPGSKVHRSGVPWDDDSGERLCAWTGLSRDELYDPAKVALVPMGFCYPGQDANGGDLPPRPECAPLWRARLLAELPRIELMLLVGGYAHRWHLGVKSGVTGTVAGWRTVLAERSTPAHLPLPHPSWRNNHWLKKHPWFEAELLPERQ